MIMFRKAAGMGLLTAIFLAGCSQPGVKGPAGSPSQSNPGTKKAAVSSAVPDRFSDAHVHLIDFLQNGAFDNADGFFKGIGSRGEIKGSKAVRYLALPFGEQWRRLSLLFRDMAASGVDHAMVSGMPFLKKWSENEPFARPRYYLDSSSRVVRARDTDYLIGAAFLEYRRKFSGDAGALARLDSLSPFICGFDGTDLGAVDLVVKRIKEFPGVWKGIGEVMSRHDDLTNLTIGDRPRGNHPALKRLCRFAGEVNLPVSIHHNIAPVSRSSSEVKEPVYLDELVDLFAYCPDTKFIWCHAGISRRVVVGNLPHWLDAVLDQFGERVYIDLSWVVFEDYILKDLDAWVALVRSHPDNFMLGSDVVGSSENLAKELRRYRPFLEKISSDPKDPVRRKLALENFSRLDADLGQKRRARMIEQKLIPVSSQSTGLVLPHDYDFPEKAHTGALEESFIKKHRP